MPALEPRGSTPAGAPAPTSSSRSPRFVVTGTTEEEMAAAATGVREQIAFYGSTPAYRGVLEHHGWGDLQPELNALSKQGEWKQMGDAHRRRHPRDLRRGGRARPGGRRAPAAASATWSTGVSFYTPYQADLAPAAFAPAIERLRCRLSRDHSSASPTPSRMARMSSP